VANHFLKAKQERVKAGELSPRTWNEYKAAAERLRAVTEHVRKWLWPAPEKAEEAADAQGEEE
jgi:hypothetical protein